MAKFFVDKESVNDDNIIITGSDVSHIKKVLRMREGDSLTISDKAGMDYECEITSIGQDEVVCAILSKKACETEPEVFVTLYQCIPKSGKMDSIIQKAVELGVGRIVPVLSKRCVAKAEKTERWQKISSEAVKQCKRGVIPEVAPAMTFAEAVKEFCQNEVALFPYEEAKDGAINVQKGVKTVGIMIGPEGGFDKTEVEMAEKLGAKIVTLGKRILRTETAGSTVLSIVMFNLGEMS